MDEALTATSNALKSDEGTVFLHGGHAAGINLSNNGLRVGLHAGPLVGSLVVVSTITIATAIVTASIIAIAVAVAVIVAATLIAVTAATPPSVAIVTITASTAAI